MRKTYLITAILLLSAVWAVAQSTPSTPPPTTPDTTSSQPASPQPASPSSTSPIQQPTTPDSSTTTQTTTQTTQTSTDSSTSIEGCLNGSAGSFTLTDQSGKTWQLAGDTAKLGDHVGHQLRISGTDNSGSASSPSSGAGSSASSSGAMGSSSGQSTFTVKKVRMISSSCSTSK
jgi:hypothetical protein